MAITTFDGYVASTKQYINYTKTATVTTIAAQPYTVFDMAGNPGAGTLGGTSTTTGVVPTDATTGCPTINAFGGSATGYLTGIRFRSTVASTIAVYDLLWKGGAYAYNASTSGNTPTSFLSRIPGGTAADTAGCTEIWVETVTAATGNQTWNVTYNDEGGASSSTGAVGIGAAPTIRRMWQLPLASGDKGCSGVTGVVGGTGSAGTANILVMRPLWMGRIAANNDGGTHGIAVTGMPIVYADSALFVMVYADSTSSGVPWLQFEISNG